MPLAALWSRDGALVAIHVVAKGTEMGAMAGAALGAAAALATAVWGGKGRNPIARLLRACELGVALGAVWGAFAVLGKAATDPSMSEDGVRDRAHRIENSVSTLKTDLDNKFLVGGAVGALAVAAAPSSLVDDDAAVREQEAGFVDRVIRGFSLGGGLAFALGGGATVAEKMLKKQLVMS